MTDQEQTSVLDALIEVAILRPEIAADSPHFVSSRALRQALAFIPDEHHTSDHAIGARFVASVVANARALARSPYTVALFALDA
ncbi:MAG TPA: hypothetical protein VM221_06040 [Armatimonadota bacterium]|nr:hypothetical protein [Armatimonadota bacterium]